MPRVLKAKRKLRSTVVAPAKKIRKQRVGNVRDLILKALRSGSLGRPALEKATGASYNALIMHLTKLKKEGLVTLDSSNRILTLAGSATTGEKGAQARQKTKPSKKRAVSSQISMVPALIAEPIIPPAVVGYSRSDLKAAIDQFVLRIEPIKALDDKLLVLEQLSSQLGGPIAEVLADIKADLLRS